jgi:hypothetical protein
VEPEKGDSLLDFVSSVAGEELLKVEENLGDGFVRLRVSEAERRQAKHDIRWVEDAVVELLRNSRDAGASRIFLATSKDGHLRRLVCIDDGEGIPEHLQEAVFEPRVTSKLETMTMDSYGVHGRGMALYSLMSNAVEAGVVWSRPRRGTTIALVADTSVLAERKDQSTWPETQVFNGTPAVVKGPHNIVRTAVEFALEASGVDVFVGTPADVLSTMRSLAAAERTMDSLFDDAQADDLDVWHRAATAVDPERLCLLARELYGFSISHRNAQRMLAEDIPPLQSIVERLGGPSPPPQKPKRAVDLAKDRRTVRLEQQDLDTVAAAAVSAFRQVAEKYYLQTDPEVRVSATSDEIRIKLLLQKLE